MNNRLKFYFLVLFSMVFYSASGQKVVIDTNAYRNWITLNNEYNISRNGQYVFYGINNQPVGSQTLVVQTIKNGSQLLFKNINPLWAQFTDDSKQVVFKQNDDRLCVVTLSNGCLQYIDSVNNFSIKDNWLVYSIALSKNLVLENLHSGKRVIFYDVENYIFSNDDKFLALERKSDNKLILVELTSGQYSIIDGGYSFSSLIFDKLTSKLAYLAQMPGSKQKQIKLYTISSQKIKVHFLERESDTLTVSKIKCFSDSGNALILVLKLKKRSEKIEKKNVPLMIWNYIDPILPSEQIKRGQQQTSYTAYISLVTDKIQPLIYNNASIELKHHNGLGDVALISSSDGYSGRGEEDWNRYANTKWYLEELDQNILTELKSVRGFRSGTIKFSPDGKYLVFYDPNNSNFFSYELSTRRYKNITRQINTNWKSQYRNDLPNSDYNIRGIAGWLPSQHSVLLYDQNDIWKVDLKGENRERNLTQGLGMSTNIIFEIQPFNRDNDHVYFRNKKLILNAFNTKSKENGFYSKTVDDMGDPEKLTMGPFIFSLSRNPYVENNARSQIKSSDNGVYLLQRMNESESPNLFVTTDFKSFRPITNIHPENRYNWLTSELHSWKSLDGRILNGILYKPENFNAKKKYPIIFNYYERKSDGLHSFITPEPLTAGCQINIPTYVSDDFLVFCPDIYYKVGDPMQGTYDAVVSAARYVSKLPFVDSTKMGIQGCSWGGVQTDYLVTHTNFFSAACSASGVSNFISASGGLGDSGNSLRNVYETGQSRMGGSLWNFTENYIKNSAIFNVGKVTTPLLLMHTTKDGICPISDAIALFTSLRRMGKKAWMLQYDDGNHGVWGKSGEDFSIRMQQFFDHYLKDKPAPHWMLYGVDPNNPGMNSGLDLVEEKDKNGHWLMPGQGLLDTTLSKPPQTN